MADTAYHRRLAPAQRTVVAVFDRDGRRDDVWESREILLEAPNWTLDGTALILNGDGRLWRLDLAGRDLTDITPAGMPSLNNDHVLDPDGRHIFLSANDGHLYRAPLDGGPAVRISDDDALLHFLHGVSPDGAELAFIGIRRPVDGSWGAGAVYTLPAGGGTARRLTASAAAEDGSEYSPDGVWLYLNTEQFDGHAQIARVRRDGGDLEQLTVDERVNWFPHLSPDGSAAVYIAFPPGTEGHPADLPVELRLVEGGDWRHPRTLAHLFGGQGTINVNSWAPDSTRFAAVAYPLD
ncbi:biopolymer transporter Tol [Microbacterium sp. W1N]|uniref:TolB family protein n=1 Tax=Microbacterium festucae TaxID=2977531 RepID=UPI0021C22B7A|nr:biopolymer transporter Tol [Microbacterium festucae]MCT9819171.1 biopolymer transporter Tol [Microbacterium festucae]